MSTRGFAGSEFEALKDRFIFLKSKDGKLAARLGLRGPVIAILTPEGEVLRRAAKDDAASIVKAMSEAGDLYRDRDIEWASSIQDVSKTAKEGGKLVLVVVGDDGLARPFGAKSLALLRERVCFVRLKAESEEAKGLKIAAEPAVVALYITEKGEPDELRREDKAMTPAEIKKFLQRSFDTWADLTESR